MARCGVECTTTIIGNTDIINIIIINNIIIIIITTQTSPHRWGRSGIIPTRGNSILRNTIAIIADTIVNIVNILDDIFIAIVIVALPYIHPIESFYTRFTFCGSVIEVVFSDSYG